MRRMDAASGTWPGRVGGAGRRQPWPASHVGLLALYGVSTVLCAYGALFPPTPVTPRATNAVLAVVGVLAIALVVASRGRQPRSLPHLLLGVYVVGVGVSVAAAGTQAGALSAAVSVVWVGLYAALCFSPGVARAHNVFAVAVLAYAIARSVGGGAGWAAWAVVGLSALVAAELLAREHGGVRSLARTDPLTGAANRLGLEEEGTALVQQAVRAGRSLTVAVLDLDGFKGLNDRHGHQVGDAMLAGLVDEWRAGIRRQDLLARTGGDEFALLLPDTSQVAAEELLARLRARSAGAWTYGAASLQPGDDLDTLLARADRCLYAAKPNRR